LAITAWEINVNNLVYWTTGMMTAAVAAAVSTSAVSAQDKYSLQVPGGIAFAELRGVWHTRLYSLFLRTHH
jgi:hypothetical protein